VIDASVLLAMRGMAAIRAQVPSVRRAFSLVYETLNSF
jgi:hypothetical protein